MTITQGRLKQVLRYDSETGEFVWIHHDDHRVAGKVLGKIAGTIAAFSNSKKPYRKIAIDGKPFFAHRLAWFYVHGYFPSQIDHIDGDGTNNRITNLREVSPRENSHNMRRHSRNVSGTSGVSWHAGARKWQARIQIDGKPISLGLYHDINKAIEVRKLTEVRAGYHTNHGTDRPL